jgi:hypothetical protein
MDESELSALMNEFHVSTINTLSAAIALELKNHDELNSN